MPEQNQNPPEIDRLQSDLGDMNAMQQIASGHLPAPSSPGERTYQQPKPALMRKEEGIMIYATSFEEE